MKYRAGWQTRLDDLVTAGSRQISAGQNFNEFPHPSKSELCGRVFHLIIENRNRDVVGWDADLPASGLAIWHVDECGSNDYPQATPLHHYECALVQADGKLDLERNVDMGDEWDLFFHYYDYDLAFNDWTKPSSRWWDGSFSNLQIDKISVAGQTMTFDVCAPP